MSFKWNREHLETLSKICNIKNYKKKNINTLYQEIVTFMNSNPISDKKGGELLPSCSLKNKKIYIYILENSLNSKTINNINYLSINEINKLIKDLNKNDDVRNLIISKTFFNIKTGELIDQSKQVNDFIYSAYTASKDKINFKNTTILHITNLSSFILYSDSITFESILNIYPINNLLSNFIYTTFPKGIVLNTEYNRHNITLKEEKQKQNMLLNGNSQPIVDNIFNIKNYINFSKEKYTGIFDDTGVENKQFFFIFKNDITLKNIIADFIDEKICSFGRLKQYTGTCWVNSILNALLLSELSSQLLITFFDIHYNNMSENDKKEIEKSDFSICFKESYPIHKFLFLAIYTILKKNIKLTTADEIIIGKYSKLIDHTNMKINTNLTNETNVKKYASNEYSPKSTEYIYKYIFYAYYHNFENLEDFERNFKIIENKVIFTIECWDGLNDETKLTELEETIKYEDKIFSLNSCIIVLKPNSKKVVSHTVCGFICNNDYYIYDSNNELIKYDWVKNFENPYPEDIIKTKYKGYKTFISSLTYILLTNPQ